MAKIKLTKGELKRQRDSLKQFQRYLPTLQLKKQQLQSKILEVRKHLASRMEALNKFSDDIKQWLGLLADTSVDVKKWIAPLEIKLSMTNIAGAGIPVFDGIIFEELKVDYYSTPFWVDEGIAKLRNLIKLIAEVETIKIQIHVLEKELRTTTQRVNLFEKVKIPECLESIRKIGIYLGDQMANAVGVGKVAKKKIEVKNLEEVTI